MTDRRPVKVDDRFLELLDQQLGEHRGPNGEPSATDFLLVDLPPIADLREHRIMQCSGGVGLNGQVKRFTVATALNSKLRAEG